MRNWTAQGYNAAKFVETSQAMAQHLYQVQTGAVSAGLLAVIDITVDNRHGLILMKLERDQGAEVKMKHEGQKSHFEMSILDSLILTGNTRLFKTAAFLRSGPEDDDFQMAACDNQHNATDTKEMARFWRKYLGCDLEEAARVSTSKLFSATMDFINTHLDDPELQTVMYESLHSELRSAHQAISPRAFLANHLPEPVRHELRTFLEERLPDPDALRKLIADSGGELLLSRLIPRSYHGSNGVPSPQVGCQKHRYFVLNIANLALVRDSLNR